MDLPPLAPPDHICDACAMRYADVTPPAAAALVRRLPEAYRSAFAGASDAAARRRPDPATWSMVEYLCHVRDVYVVFAERIELARTHDRPTFAPLGNDERVIRLRYAEADVTAALDELAGAAEAFADLIVSLDGEALARVASRRPGEERDVRWMVRQAAHEGRHHLDDIARVRQQVTGTGSVPSP